MTAKSSEDLCGIIHVVLVTYPVGRVSSNYTKSAQDKDVLVDVIQD